MFEVMGSVFRYLSDGFLELSDEEVLSLLVEEICSRFKSTMSPLLQYCGSIAFGRDRASLGKSGPLLRMISDAVQSYDHCAANQFWVSKVGDFCFSHNGLMLKIQLGDGTVCFNDLDSAVAYSVYACRYEVWIPLIFHFFGLLDNCYSGSCAQSVESESSCEFRLSR